MRCSICQHQLSITVQRSFETLCEHVMCCDEDWDPGPRNTYECINDKCKAFNKYFWNRNGEFYMIDREGHYASIDMNDFIDHETDALDSMSREISLSVKEKNKK